LTPAEVFGNMCALAALSPIHRKWSVADAQRLFLPPIALGQFLMLPDGSAFVTWACLSDEIAKGFFDKTHALNKADWTSGPELWAIDFIAPFGNARTFIREIRKAFPKGTLGRARRTYASGRRKYGEWINA
jgi:cytolysin-activating lysine-acyltransferase